MFRLFIFFTISLSMQTAGAAIEADISGVQQNARPAPLPPAYPKWSERVVHKVTVPVPPPGPYMSTGLLDTRRGFRCCENRNTQQMYSPLFNNMPWPERRRPPQQWMPPGGQYNYVPGNIDAPRSGQWPMPSGMYGNSNRPMQPWQPMYQRPPQFRY